MEQRGNRLDKFYIAFAAMLVFLVVIIFIDKVNDNRANQMPRKNDEIGNWSVIRADGSVESVEFPAKIKAGKDEKVVIETILPGDIRDNMWVYYYCLAGNKVYVDGDLRKTYDRNANGVIGGTVSNVSLFLSVNASDAGKKIRIEFDDPLVRDVGMYEVYYGDNLGLIVGIMKKNAVIALLGLLLLFTCVVVTVIDVSSAISAGRKLMIVHLAIGAILAASWISFSSASSSEI